MLPVSSENKTDWTVIFVRFFLILSYVAILSIIRSAGAYVAQAFIYLKTFNFSNIKLLNNMHEGVLIVTQTD